MLGRDDLDGAGLVLATKSDLEPAVVVWAVVVVADLSVVAAVARVHLEPAVVAADLEPVVVAGARVPQGFVFVTKALTVQSFGWSEVSCKNKSVN